MPVITTQNRLRESVSLITVEVTSTINVGFGEPLKMRDQCVELLRLCMLPNKDLLMPPLTSPRDKETLFTVSSVNLKGAEVMLERIRSHLECCPELQTASVRLSATSIHIPVLHGRELGQGVQRVVDNIMKWQ